MNVLGIIAEYNPFHNGHLYQLQKSVDIAEADFVVAIISGNFTQRGETPLFSKWKRSEMAVECGVDLVIELPFAFACNNAEYFAKGAIEILNRLDCITHLSFGSESGDLNLLKKTADFLSRETEDFKFNLKNNLKNGQSYPKARFEAVKACLGEEASEILTNPNNILAIEYLKQLNITNSDIIPITVKRMESEYHDTTLRGSIASASALRKALIEDSKEPSHICDFIPFPCLKTFESAFKDEKISASSHEHMEQLYYKILTAKILSASSYDLSHIFSVSEGLENNLKSAVRHSNNLFELKERIKSKRYTSTRISRMLAHILMGLTKTDFNAILEAEKYYARILAFNQKGAKLLKYIKKNENTNIPCITNLNKEADSLIDCQLLLSYDLFSSDLYNLLWGNNIYNNSDQIKKPYHKI